MSSNLFCERPKTNAVLLVDFSGSTSAKFDKHITVLEKMVELCCTLDYETYNLVCWNSYTSNYGKFIGGQVIIPFNINRNSLYNTFIAITNAGSSGGSTQPHLGFMGMKSQWFNKDTDIIFVTDGQIDSDVQSRDLFVKEIKKLKHQLTIIAVENIIRDNSQVENFNNSVGGDIYRIIQENGLTKYVSKFISYNPVGSLVQINKTTAPPGFVVYGDKYFDILRLPEFIEYLKTELNAEPVVEYDAKVESNVESDTNVALDNSSNINNNLVNNVNTDLNRKQLEIAQKLSTTLEILTRDKPARLVRDIISTFSRLFTIDHNLIEYIITGAIEQEKRGSAFVYADYRQNLKNLFSQANNLLESNVKNAIGLSGMRNFISLMNNRILTGVSDLVEESVSTNGKNYPFAGYTNYLPVFPAMDEKTQLTSMQDQCLRQWIRIVYSRIHNYNPLADEIIYLVLGDMYRVCNSEVPEIIKENMKQLAYCILRKKRLNTNQTELDKLLSGDLPIPNSGRYEDFEKYMQIVKTKLGVDCHILQLWYHICKTLNDELAEKQRVHCAKFMNYINNFDLPETSKVIVDEISVESYDVDFTCIISCENLIGKGGYKFNPHVGFAGRCAPKYLISAESKEALISRNILKCPVCYKIMDPNDMTFVESQFVYNIPDYYKSNNEFMKIQQLNNYGQNYGNNNRNNNGQNNYLQLNNEQNNYLQLNNGQNKYLQNNYLQNNGNNNVQNRDNVLKNANGKTGKLVIMKGVVGSGKSTLSQRINQQVTSRGGMCIVTGTDKYCLQGMNIRDAVFAVNRELENIRYINNDDLVVVIDTCGERYKNERSYVFNINFNGWTHYVLWPNLDRTDLQGYFAWSLRNVLSRTRPNQSDNYYLWPFDVEKCKKIHKVKCGSLFSRNVRLWNFYDTHTMNVAANRYSLKLNNLDIDISNI